MRFLLVEDVPRITNDEINKWRTASDAAREDMVDDIIQRYDKPGLQNLKNAMIRNFNYFGIDPSDNEFMTLLDELEFIPSQMDNANFEVLSDYAQAGRVDLSHDYLRNGSLYDRSRNDFEYTVNAFETVMDPRQLSRYFKDTTYINTEQFIDESGDIKPAGKKGDTGIDTIYGTIEQWSTTDSGKDNTTGEKNSGLYSLNDALKQLDVRPQIQNQVIKEWIKRYFPQASKQYQPLSNDVDYYTETFDYIVNSSSYKPLTNRQKELIRNQYRYYEQKDIPRSLWRNGQIVWLAEREHSTAGPDPRNSINDFVIYNDGQWIVYDDFIQNQGSSGSNADKVRNDLFNTKIIKDKSNKISIVAGLLELLDDVDLDAMDGEEPIDINDYI